MCVNVCRTEAGQEVLSLLLTTYEQHATPYLLTYLLTYLLNNEHTHTHPSSYTSHQLSQRPQRSNYERQRACSIIGNRRTSTIVIYDVLFISDNVGFFRWHNILCVCWINVQITAIWYNIAKKDRFTKQLHRVFFAASETQMRNSDIHCGSKKMRQLWRTITTKQFSRF